MLRIHTIPHFFTQFYTLFILIDRGDERHSSNTFANLQTPFANHSLPLYCIVLLQYIRYKNTSLYTRAVANAYKTLQEDLLLFYIQYPKTLTAGSRVLVFGQDAYSGVYRKRRYITLVKANWNASIYR